MALPTTLRKPYIIEPRGTYQELRDLAVRNTPEQITFTVCRTTVGDGYCLGWYWNKDSTDPDNNETVLAPTGRAVGRWHAMGTASGSGGGGSLPPLHNEGDLIMNVDGQYRAVQPITSLVDGWLTNDFGWLLVNLYPEDFE